MAGKHEAAGKAAVYAKNTTGQAENRAAKKLASLAERALRKPSSLDVQYLRSRGDLRGLMNLLSYYDPSDPTEAAQVRRAAALALPDLRDPRVISILATALYDNSSIVRAAAAEGLGKLSTIIPVTGGRVSASGLTLADRTRILSALFPLLHKERVDDVRAAAAEAVFRAGGRAVLRPLIALARQGALPFQRWFVRWAARSQQDELMIDLYPWAPPEIRDLIVERLCSRLSSPVLVRLASARECGDRDLEELLQRVLG